MLTGFDAQRAAYFSPDGLDSHTPSVEVRLRVGAVELGANLGRSFAAGGTSGGALVEARWSQLRVAARFQVQDQLYYQSRRAWLALEVNWEGSALELPLDAALHHAAREEPPFSVSPAVHTRIFRAHLADTRSSIAMPSRPAVDSSVVNAPDSLAILGKLANRADKTTAPFVRLFHPAGGVYGILATWRGHAFCIDP